MKEKRDLNPVDLIGDALRVLKRLAAPGARLTRRGDVYALTGTGRAGRALHVPPSVVEAMRRRDWLSNALRGDPDADALVLSDVGLSWLRRTVEGDEPRALRLAASGEFDAPGEGGATPVAVNDAESPVALLRAARDDAGKPLIDETQFIAAERLRRDFTLAQLAPRLTVDLSALVVAGRRGAQHGEISDIALAARQRFSRAVTALGAGLSDVAIDVCCFLKELDAADSTCGWSQSASLVVLRLALDRLAAHYGFHATGAGARTRAWRAPDDDVQHVKEAG
jgi:Domain of unknown function (DUF6456)